MGEYRDADKDPKIFGIATRSTADEYLHLKLEKIKSSGILTVNG
ncbi:MULTISPECIES: hypothetical protein [unclassified Tolypothrix]|nr:MULTISPECIES: hypothetical protein [unclassified Tolypothrix]EKE97753.1 hypothetical protein FDUTEX481_04703 [Tolypothrix sp. PCC 7601]BAY89265.1 hypothetical protein NIES3275_12680 [Microchaete diplosiphon NIES-3275]